MTKNEARERAVRPCHHTSVLDSTGVSQGLRELRECPVFMIEKGRVAVVM